MSTPEQGGAASSVPPETSQDVIDPKTTSVLQLGLAPWMRTSTSDSVTAPAARVPTASNETELRPAQEERGQSANMLQGVRSVQQKELESGARRELRVEQVENEIKARAQTREHLRTCRFYFWLGCCGLPLVHFMSVWYFRKELSGPDGDFNIRKYVLLSCFFASFQCFALVLWYVIFRLLGETTEKISVLNFHSMNMTKLL